MKLQHRRPRLTGPRQTQTGLLCLFFAAGILAGFLARRIVKSDDLSALGSYVSSYASLTVQQPADIISVLWAYLRYPAAAFLLGFTAWGVMLLPLLCTAQGFFLSFSVHCFAASLGRGGVTLALAALTVLLLEFAAFAFRGGAPRLLIPACGMSVILCAAALAALPALPELLFYAGGLLLALGIGAAADFDP